MKNFFFITLALLLSACSSKPSVKIQHLSPAFFIDKANTVEAEVTMSAPIDKIIIKLSSEGKWYEVEETHIEYNSNKKKGLFSVEYTFPPTTKVQDDTIFIGAIDSKGQQFLEQYRIRVAYSDDYHRGLYKGE